MWRLNPKLSHHCFFSRRSNLNSPFAPPRIFSLHPTTTSFLAFAASNKVEGGIELENNNDNRTGAEEES